MLVEEPGVIRVREDELHNLVLLLSDTGITAVGREGIVWRSPRVVVGDLKVTAIFSDRIVVAGYLSDAEIQIDPASGSVRTT